MFTSSRRPERPDSYETGGGQGAGATIIARGVRVEGDFTSQGDVQIEGDVNGHVSTSSLLTIGNEAKLKAEVAAEDAVIAGSVDGTITVKKRLELKATAKIIGDIICETAVVEAGATLNGKFVVGPHKTASVKEEAPSKAKTAEAAV